MVESVSLDDGDSPGGRCRRGLTRKLGVVRAGWRRRGRWPRHRKDTNGSINKNVGGRKRRRKSNKIEYRFQARSDPDQNNDHVSHFCHTVSTVTGVSINWGGNKLSLPPPPLAHLGQTVPQALANTSAQHTLHRLHRGRVPHNVADLCIKKSELVYRGMIGMIVYLVGSPPVAARRRPVAPSTRSRRRLEV